MIGEDARGRIWMSLRFDGIVQLDADLNFAAFHTTQAANPFGLMSKRVLRRRIDRRQTLWLGNVKGGKNVTERSFSVFTNPPGVH